MTLSILQLCYQFTLIARLAPKWNEIGKWLLKGILPILYTVHVYIVGNDIFETGRGQGLSKI